MIYLLDRAWFAIESVSIHPFADKKMEEQEYLRSFPAMVFYYTMKEGYYAGKQVESIRPMSKDEKHVKRSKLLVGYLKKVKERWNQSNYLKKFVKENPVVEALLQVDLLSELEDVIHGSIWTHEFDCEKNPYIKDYIKIRQEFIDPGGEKPAYLRMKDKKQSDLFYYLAINSGASKFYRYLIKEFCKVEVAGKVDFSFYSDPYDGKRADPEKRANRSMESFNAEELSAIRGK
jgi:hypothetical protein